MEIKTGYMPIYPSSMQTINNSWSNYLNNYEWTHTATVRLHYKISELSVDKITTSLVKYKPINYLFYSLENDRYDINHIHLLLNATSTIDRDSIAKGLGKYEKAISYLDEVKSNEAISWYCSKNLNQGIPYDLKIKEQF